MPVTICIHKLWHFKNSQTFPRHQQIIDWCANQIRKILVTFNYCQPVVGPGKIFQFNIKLAITVLSLFTIHFNKKCAASCQNFCGQCLIY